MNLAACINLCSKLVKQNLNLRLEKEGITAKQFLIIKTIETFTEQPEKIITAADITEILDMDMATVSGILKRLVDKELVIKEVHPYDKRAFRLKLTEQCLSKIPAFNEHGIAVIELMKNNISDEEINNLCETIEKIINNLRVSNKEIPWVDNNRGRI